MCPELQMICQEVCSWIYLAKLSDFLIRNHKIFSDRSAHRKQRLSPVNLILVLRYLRLDYYKRLSIACIGKPGSGLYRMLKQRTSAWNACINKNMNICIHHYPILLFYAVFSLNLFDFIVILRPLRFRSIYHNSFLTSLYVLYLSIRSLCSLNNVASIPPSYICFSRSSRLFGYYRRFMRKYQLHILYNLAYSSCSF